RCCGVAGAGHADLHTLECSISIQPSKPAGKVPPTLPSERFVNDGRTANVGRAPRLAFGLRVRARKLRGNEIIGWTGAPLRRLAAPSPPPWDRGRRLCRFSISIMRLRTSRPKSSASAKLADAEMKCWSVCRPRYHAGKRLD